MSGLNLLTIKKDPFAERVKAAWDNLSEKVRKADLEAFEVEDLKQLTQALCERTEGHERFFLFHMLGEAVRLVGVPALAG